MAVEANEIACAQILPNDRTCVILTDGSRWERAPGEACKWERVHGGLPSTAWTPSSEPTPATPAQPTWRDKLLDAFAGPMPVVRDQDGTEEANRG